MKKKKRNRNVEDQPLEEEFIDIVSPTNEENRARVKANREDVKFLHIDNVLSALNGDVLLKKTEYDVSEKISYSINLLNAISGPKSKFFFKIYLRHTTGKSFLLKSGITSIKNKKKLTGTLKFSTKIPPVAEVTIQIVLYRHQTVLKSFESGKLIIRCKKPKKYIDVKAIELNLIQEDNSATIFYWLIFNVKPFPGEIKTIIKTELVNRTDDSNFIDIPYTIKYDPVLGRQQYKIPIKVKSGPIDTYGQKFNVKVQVLSTDSRELLYNSIQLAQIPETYGKVLLKNVKYQSDTKIGEVAYMFAEVKNGAQKKIKGNLDIGYYTKELGYVRGFNQKFKIPPNDYDTISGDVPYYEFLAGFPYWIVANCSFKSNGKTSILKNISEQKTPRHLSKRHFIVRLRTNLPQDLIHTNEKVAIGVDVRLDVDNLQKATGFKVIENFENINKRILFETSLGSKEILNKSFHWRVPRTPGTYSIYVEFFHSGKKLAPSNTECNKLKFEIRAKIKN